MIVSEITYQRNSSTTDTGDRILLASYAWKACTIISGVLYFLSDGAWTTNKNKTNKKNVELLRMTSVYWSLTIIERFVEEVSSSSIWRRLLNWVRAIKLYIRVIMNKNKSGPLKSNICWNQIFPQHILTNCGVGNLDCSPLVTVTWKIGQVKPIKS